VPEAVYWEFWLFFFSVFIFNYYLPYAALFMLTFSKQTSENIEPIRLQCTSAVSLWVYRVYFIGVGMRLSIWWKTYTRCFLFNFAVLFCDRSNLSDQFCHFLSFCSFSLTNLRFILCLCCRIWHFLTQISVIDLIYILFFHVVLRTKQYKVKTRQKLWWLLHDLCGATHLILVISVLIHTGA